MSVVLFLFSIKEKIYFIIYLLSVNIFNARMSTRTLSKNSIYDILIMIITYKYDYILIL